MIFHLHSTHIATNVLTHIGGSDAALCVRVCACVCVCLRTYVDVYIFTYIIAHSEDKWTYFKIHKDIST